jgi:MFS family permease
MDELEWGVVGSMYTLGGLLGALSAGPLAGRYGRRRTMQLTSIFFIIGPVLEALSPNIGVMSVGRLLSGVGAGASVVVVPIYISEIAPPAQKGFFGAFTQIMCNVGILLTQLLGYFLSHGSYWRIILAAGGFIGVLQSLGLLFSVESPKYLAEQGHTSQAKKVLRSLRGEDTDINDEYSSWGADGTSEVIGMFSVLDRSNKLTQVQTKSKPFSAMTTSPPRRKRRPTRKKPSASYKSSDIQTTKKPRLPSS